MSVDVALVSAFPRFKALHPETQRDLAAAMELRAFRPGQYVVFEDDPRCGMFGLLEGRVRLARTAADGREQVLAIAGPGELFNLVPLVDAGPAPATARAMAPTRCLHLPAEALAPLIGRHPGLALLLLRDLAAQVRDMSVLLEDLAFRTVRARLARILLHEAAVAAAPGTRAQRVPGVAPGSPVAAPAAALTHQELAARAGTVREIIGRTLRQMADEGLVELARGNVVVLDIAGLRALVE